MEKKYIEEEYDIIVVGAGHAGCEAALAASRLGLETILFTISMDSVALMPCNPMSVEAPKDIWYVKLMP